MGRTTTKSAFWKGFGDGSPFVLAAAPFSILFGVLGTEAGLNLLEVMSMAILVIAGAAQFTALTQMNDAAPVALVVGAALAVNLRMAMYSAHLSDHFRGAPLWQRVLGSYILIDNAYAVGIKELEARPNRPQPEKIAYYIGCAVPVWVVWYAGSLFGALIGQTIPDSIPLEFAVPLAFLSIVAPMVRTLAHLAAALTSIVLTLALVSLPFNLELMIAGLIALIVGVRVERWSTAQ